MLETNHVLEGGEGDSYIHSEELASKTAVTAGWLRIYWSEHLSLWQALKTNVP